MASGPASADILKKLEPVRYCVMVLWACYFIQTVYGIFLSPMYVLNTLSLFFLAVSGTYLLMNDEKLASCYGLLVQSPLSFCGAGGLQCAVPFVIMTVFSVIYGLFELYQVMDRLRYYTDTLTFLHALAKAAEVLASSIGGFTVYNALKDIISARPPENAFSSQPPQYFSLAQNTRSVTAFQGSGQRLGGV